MAAECQSCPLFAFMYLWHVPRVLFAFVIRSTQHKQMKTACLQFHLSSSSIVVVLKDCS